jgi:hypothetical protein
MKTDKRHEAKPGLRDWLLKGYVYPLTALLALSGVMMLMAAMESAPLLRQTDPLTGLSTRTLLRIVGCLHVAVAGWLCLERDLLARGLLLLWVACNWICYSAGTAWAMNVSPPFPLETMLAWKVGVGQNLMHLLCQFLLAYMVGGGLLALASEWRRTGQLKAEAFLRHWEEVRQAPHAPATPGGRTSTPAQTSSESPGNQGSRARSPSQTPSAAEPGPPDLRFSCPKCGQHIRCEAGYSGRKITCPACRQEILVPGANQEAAPPHNCRAWPPTEVELL